MYQKKHRKLKKNHLEWIYQVLNSQLKNLIPEMMNNKDIKVVSDLINLESLEKDKKYAGKYLFRFKITTDKQEKMNTLSPRTKNV